MRMETYCTLETHGHVENKINDPVEWWPKLDKFGNITEESMCKA